MRKTLVPSLLALLAAGGAHAQPPRAAPSPAPDGGGPGAAVAATEVGEVVVVAGRRPQLLDQVGQSVTVLTADQLRLDQEPVVSDVLARTPGVSFSRNGGPGETTSLRIRGAEADQTVVLIDGVKLNDPASTGGGYNFADLLVGDTARIEVLRGPQSTLYGGQAIGGVVNIVTAAPTRALEGSASLEGGSYDTAYGRAALGGVAGRLRLRGAASSYVTSGVSAFDRRAGGGEDDGYHNTSLSGRADYALAPGASVDLRGYYAEARNEFDGFGRDSSEFGRTQQLVGYGGLNWSLGQGRLQSRAAVQYTQNDRQNFNPAQGVTPRTFEATGINRRFEYQGTAKLTEGWTAVFGAETERSAFSTASPSALAPRPRPTKADVTVNSGYGQLQVQALPNLSLTGGVRFDDHETFGSRATGQASAAWTVRPGAILRASWGQGFKPPTLYQLYSQYGSLDLRPETADGWDAGLEQRLTFWRTVVQITGFGRDSEDLITFFSCPTGRPTGRCVAQPFGYYVNTARTEARGIELAGSVQPLPALELSGNYTWLDARDTSPGAVTNGRELTRRPAETANLLATWRGPLGLTASAAMRYAGRSFDNAANTTRVKGYTLVDLRGSIPVHAGVELYGRVENLFDREYSTVFRYGALGRAGYVGVRAAF